MQLRIGQGQGNPRQGLGGFQEYVHQKYSYRMQHRRNIPCNQIRYPECGNVMI